MKIFKKEPNFQFMNKRGYAFIFSGIIIVLGVFLFNTVGFNLGIDFTGGTNIEVSFRQDVSIDQLRDALGEVGLGKSMIQRVGQDVNKFFIKTVKSLDTETKAETDATAEDESESESEGEVGITKIIEEALKTPGEKELKATKLDLNNSSQPEIAGWLVSKGVNRTTAEETASQLTELRTTNDTGLINSLEEIEGLGLKPQAAAVLKEHTYLGDFTFLSEETVGPQVGHDLRQKASLATVWAMLGMLIYIAIRFRFIFGIAAVITLLHDVLISLTFILLFQVEVSLSVVAGILTIVGYSLNDTIVIFDRVRDNMKIMKRQESERILDTSINQTLSRTIVTSGTTLCVVLALFFFGGEVIHAFSFTLLVGVITGTYSSVFQSCAWLRIWEQKTFGGAKKK
ncbi:MAG: protein translocase subunit SecF [Candidatus Aminicenantes bacterium]|nr:MAG: protein translocase subunit SecF [Candidatus Aminicenantes bacterium]